MPGARRWPLIAALAAGVVALDQWTKSLVVRDLGPASAVHATPLIGDWFSIAYAENRGAAFGLLGAQPLLVATVALVVLALVLAHSARSGRGSAALLIGVVVANALRKMANRRQMPQPPTPAEGSFPVPPMPRISTPREATRA